MLKKALKGSVYGAIQAKQSGRVFSKVCCISAVMACPVSLAHAQVVSNNAASSAPKDQGAGDPAASSAPKDQGAGDPKDQGVGDVVVTAERREGRLQATPIAISALTRGMLADRQIDDVQRLESVVPGLRLTTSISNPTTVTISLRGSTQQDAALVTAESPVGIYVDDIYIARLEGANTPLDDVERVEVLRGPQGTLYGRNTLSGALKIITRTPGNTAWSTATAGYGTFGSYRVSGSVGSPIVTDKVAVSLAASAAGTDGSYNNVATGQEFGRQRSYMARGKVRLTPSAPLDITASLSYYHSRSQATANVPGLAPNDPQITTSEITPRFGNPYDLSIPPLASTAGIQTVNPTGRVSQLISSLNAGYDFGGVTARSITGYVKTRDFFSTDLAGLNNSLPLAGDATSKAFSQELQLLGTSFGDRFKWILGGYYFHEAADQEIDLVTRQFSSVRTNSYAAFGQGTFQLSGPLSVTAGLRYTNEHKRFVGAIRSLAFPFPNSDFTSSDTFSAWTPKASVNYTLATTPVGWIDSVLLYASAARGFKSGGYNGTPVTDPGVLRTVYRPETNWTYEGGIKTDLIKHRLRANAAYFISDISNLVSTANRQFNGVTVYPEANIGDAQIRGLELELTATPVRNLNFFANTTLQQGHYGRIETTSAAAIAQQTFGNAQIQQLPKYAFTLGFDDSVDLDIGSGALTLKFGGDWYRTGKYAFSVPNDLIINAYSRLNGFVALEVSRRVEFRVSGTNLANKVQYQGGVKGLSYLLLPPRQIMGTIELKM